MAEGEFVVTYSNQDIMNKLNSMHEDVRLTNGKVKFHTKLIWGAYGFTFAAFMLVLKIAIANVG